MLFEILALVSTITVIILLKRLVNIFPSLLACLIRWKESINLEASVKHSLDRDMIAAAMILPFCLTVYMFGLYTPSFISGMCGNFQLLTVIGIFLAYVAIRGLMSRILRPHRMSPKTYKAAEHSAFTFFIILTLLLMGTGSIMDFIKVDRYIIKSAMLWLSAAIYCIFLFRKTQIFKSSCSIFAGFLYLCGLEIFPTGVLVASALIL